MMMGAGGLGAAGAGAGFGRVGGGATDAEDAAWEQQVAEDAALAQLEDEAMRRDDDWGQENDDQQVGGGVSGVELGLLTANEVG
jgi:hypothetical protein